MSASPQETLAELLRGAADGEALRRSWMQALLRASGATLGYCFNLSYELATEQLRCADVLFAGSDTCCSAEQGLSGVDFVSLFPTVEDLPPPNAFRCESREELSTPLRCALWDQHGVVECLSIQVVDAERRFVGHLALLRGSADPRFFHDSETERKAWERATVELLRESHGMLCSPPLHRSANLYRHGRSWMQSRRQQERAPEGYEAAIERALEDFACRGEDERVLHRNGARINLSRLEGEGQVAHLVVVEPLEVPVVTPLALLSPVQRAVACRLAIGCTVAEIAKELERSVATAKTHQRKLYERLDINHRIELAQLVERAMDWRP